MLGERCNSQAKATCMGVAPCCWATADRPDVLQFIGQLREPLAEWPDGKIVAREIGKTQALSLKCRQRSIQLLDHFGCEVLKPARVLRHVLAAPSGRACDGLLEDDAHGVGSFS